MHNNLRVSLYVLLACLVLLGAGFTATQVNAQEQQEVPIYFFWGDGCPHCAAAKPFLANLAEENPELQIQAFEVWGSLENQKKFAEFAGRYGFEPQYVPTIFIGDQYWVGWNDQISAEVEAAAKKCLTFACPDPATYNLTESEQTTPGAANSNQITVPLLGVVDLGQQSLVLSTALIAFVDGFNPCSLWVLSMLMALVIHTGSRKKVLLIGVVFLTVTALIYALFITGLFSALTVMSFTGWVSTVVALVALIFAFINIKDYFWYKEGVSLTISDKAKPGIFQNMRRVIASGDNIWALTGATVVMAAGVSLVEFSCTAGFPVLWTNLLTTQGVTVATFVLLLLLYLLIYQLDELVIFATVVFTLKASRFEEKQGRILKLVGGMLMLALALVMLINPNLMDSLSTSLIIFGAAFAATLLVLFIHRKVLPKFGIWIGSEAKKSKRARRRASHR